MIDPEQERIRLSGLYAGMDDGQLEDLAGDRASLTDVARTALESEMARRGLAVSSGDATSAGLQDLATIRTYSGSGEALLAKGLLESGGIECVLSDENGALQDLEGLGAASSIRLQVWPEDVEAAKEVLSELLRESDEFNEEPGQDSSPAVDSAEE
jgi:hypothetical protein